MTEIEARAYAWKRGDDTGVSSNTIWYTMMGLPWASWWRPSPPMDPADLGRCHRLLDAIPEWRERLPEVVRLYPEWGPLVREWDRLIGLYLRELPSGSAPECYAAMQALLAEGDDRPRATTPGAAGDLPT